MPASVQQWFIEQIETFAPTAWHEERQRLYVELCALHPPQDITDAGDMCLFVLAQIVAAAQLRAPAAGKWSRGRSAHETWYGKERQRIVKLLQQITESPVIAAFQVRLRYYADEEVTCPHGRNRKTCEALYASCLTIRLLEHHPPTPGVRKLVERWRRLTPDVPPLHDLCVPQVPDAAPAASTSLPAGAVETSAVSADAHVLYLLGTVGSRLRQAGLSVDQSCALVDRILSWCFGDIDPAGTRPPQLAELWRRLW